MVKQQVTLSTILCALLFSSVHSVASTHISAQSASSNNAMLQPTEANSDFDSTLVAAVDGATFVGMSDSNALAEFAVRVSGLQHQSGGELSAAASRYGHASGYLPRVDYEQHSLTTITGGNNGVNLSETGTLLLVTLGLAALALSRRRIKFTHGANGQASDASRQASVNSTLADVYELKSTQHRQLADEQKASDAVAPAGDTERPSQIRKIVTPTARTADKNPYPELAQSVQKLEALADEMAHLS